MKKITIETLKKLQACEDQLVLFEKTFPDGAEITFENCHKAVIVGLNITWLAWELFSPNVLAAYLADTALARAVYAKVVDAAYTAYLATTAPAWDVYRTIATSSWDASTVTMKAPQASDIATAWAAYAAIADPAAVLYEEVRAPARAACAAAMAQAFFRAAQMQDSTT